MNRLIPAVLCLAIVSLAAPSGPCGPMEAPRTPTSSPPLTAPLEADCNGNGVEDAVDIALGDSADSNLDGIPDECQGGATVPGAAR